MLKNDIVKCNQKTVEEETEQEGRRQIPFLESEEKVLGRKPQLSQS